MELSIGIMALLVGIIGLTIGVTRFASVRQRLTDSQREDLQVYVAWSCEPATWQAVIAGMDADEVERLLLRMARAGAPAGALRAMAAQAGVR